ncbi:hypothetical protein FUA23_01885 [Neolewinella aurantiaca]|uniref:Uncharacterized protein n=1 Tax=Neolewinella aurantiaca TaxID=2602767 RepID=A0A5C7G122_9BACT|nr:hypothetical protein [Neolewinella aurantiaca]TXF91469.1 hypothetical protein FUA23_01885 [Neolewinella aurantiaca]
MIHLQRFTTLLCLSSLLCTCGPAEVKEVEPTTVIGSIRYEESPKLLEATLNVTPTPVTAPAIVGNTLNSVSGVGNGHYRGRLQTEFSAAFDLNVTGHPAIVVRFSAPFADSIPAVLSKSRSVKIPTMKTGLTENENLVLFLEPKDRSVPKRILLQGPTSTGILTLPKETMTDVKPGRYTAYLIKQQLQKDSTATLKTSLQTEYFTKSIPVEVKE